MSEAVTNFRIQTYVIRLNKDNNIRQLCFDSKEPLFNYK